jgi:hypothetical protein
VRVEAIADLEVSGLVGRKIRFRRSGSESTFELFAAAPDAFASELCFRDDVFLPALLMCALVNREDIDANGLKSDPLLLRNCLAATRQHQDWVPRFRVPSVSNSISDPATIKQSGSAACFFSGGIDSLFTLLRHSAEFSSEPTRTTAANMSRAIHVFHAPGLNAIRRNSAAEAALSHGAERLGATLMPLFSNVMTFDREWFQNYARVTHSAGLASLARLVSSRLSTCMIASSHTYGGLHPWGSSPVVDPLYSGRDLAIVHDGSTFRRSEKTELIALSPAALATINVCDRLIEREGYVNCSRCQKCLRTMTALDLAGVQGRDATAFDWSEYSSTSFGKIYLKNWSEVSFAEELVELADRKGRTEVSSAIRSAIRRSELLSPMTWIEERVRHTAPARKGKSFLLKLRAGAYRAVGLRR